MISHHHTLAIVVVVAIVTTAVVGIEQITIAVGTGRRITAASLLFQPKGQTGATKTMGTCRCD
jgi:hypothetical protein